MEFDRRHHGQELGKAKIDWEERWAQNIVNQIKEERVDPQGSCTAADC